MSYDEEGMTRTQYLCGTCVEETGYGDWAEEILY